MFRQIIEFVLPVRLRRLSFFVRFFLVLFSAYASIISFQSHLVAGLLDLACLAYLIAYCAIPRARDCGLSPWFTLLLFIPVVCAIPMLVLTFKRTQVPRAPVE